MYCLARKDLYVPSYGKIEVPCGRCIPCMLNFSDEWAFRAELEYKRCKVACFLTLTYDGIWLPDNAELYRPHLTNFIKRLRKKHSIRYIACGEYGSVFKTNRPHFHLVIFGYDFPDRVFFKLSRSGNKLYNSAELSELWKFGWCTVEDFTSKSAVYATKYLSKIKPDTHKIKPFTTMSLKPSIGFGVLTDEDYERGYVWFKGYKRIIPRSYYMSLARKGVEYPEVAEGRKVYSMSLTDEDKEELIKKSSIFSKKLLDKLHR